MKHFKTVDAYIASSPKEVCSMLKEMRRIVKTSALKAKEGIGYGAHN